MSNSTWWILLAIAFVQVTILAIREAFRFQSMASRYRVYFTAASLVVVLSYLYVLFLMFIHTGFVSILVGLITSLFFGGILVGLIKKRFVSFSGEFLARSDYEVKLTEDALRKALNNKLVQQTMTEQNITADGIRDLYRRLLTSGIEREKANGAITNTDLIKWFFKNFEDNNVNKESLAVQLILFVRYNKVPDSFKA